MTVGFSVQDNIAILRIRNPPVNALSLEVLEGIIKYIDAAKQDSRVQAIILCSEGKIFCGGADIRAFKAYAENPSLVRLSLQEIGLQFVKCPKPIIVAVHGVAFGGGMEISLWCDYRIIHKDAKISQPEVNLGLMPGGGGCVILPRLVGIPKALDIVATGRHLLAEEAVNMGIFQKLVTGDVIKESISFAKQLVSQSYHKQSVLNLPIKEAEKVDSFIAEFKKQYGKKWKHLLAPNSCIEGVRGAVNLPPLDALKRERELFVGLVTNDQSKALRYAFFAERAASKSSLFADKSKSQPLPIERIGVIGAGTMGSSIAVCCLRAHLPVTLVELDTKALEAGEKRIRSILSEGVRRKKLTQTIMDKIMTNLELSTSLNSLSKVDLVIEAVFESMDIKKDIFSRLDNICKESAILCSNTSALNIDEMAAVTKRPHKVAGMHFFAPAHIMKLLENVQGNKSSLETLATITKLGSTLDKIPVLVKNCPGFCGNRMFHHYINESRFLIEEGALPHEVDQVIEDFGFAMGPFKTQDLSGLDVGYLNHKSKLPPGLPTLSQYINGVRVPTLGIHLVEIGRLGRKSGKGWYKYENGKPIIDGDITNTILEFCNNNKITRRKISSEEIFERCLYPLINEGFNILEEGIVAKPEDIDTIFLYGYGWPRQTGGPMYLASTIGLKNVYKSICHYQRLHDTSPYWQPSELLKKLCEKELPVDQWMTAISSKL